MALRPSTGLRNKMMGLQATVHAIHIGAGDTATLVDGGEGNADSITRVAGSWITDGFIAGDVLRLEGATTGDNDTAITGTKAAAVSALTLTLDADVVDTGEAFAAGTVLCAASGGSLKDVMRNGILRIYSGSQPADADEAYSGTLLLELTVSSGAWVAGSEDNGLEFGDAADGYIEKCGDEVWSGVAAASGTAGWFRFYANATDAGGASETLPRVDGSCGLSGADLVMPSTTITAGKTYTFDDLKWTFPYQYGA